MSLLISGLIVIEEMKRSNDADHARFQGVSKANPARYRALDNRLADHYTGRIVRKLRGYSVRSSGE